MQFKFIGLNLNDIFLRYLNRINFGNEIIVNINL